jgi:quercetin dioxygenase-like cupin family protein
MYETPMPTPPAFLVTKDAVERDPALRPGARGARKLLVTEIHPAREEEATAVRWEPPAASTRCPVQVTADLELAVFTQAAAQDRHYHRRGTELYLVLEGEMVIEVEGEDYRLAAGDMIVVNPGSVHQVKPAGTAFLCRVITANCGGRSDKYTVA